MGISLNICDEKTCIISYNPDMPSTYPGLGDLTQAASVGTYTDLLSRDINALILDYLTMEGYPNAAAKFSKEANLQPHQSEQTIQARKRIKDSILTGDIESAISALNKIDPEVCRTVLENPYTFPVAMIRL